MAKKKITAVYAYDFALKEMRPMFDIEVDSDTIASVFMRHALFEEKAKKKVLNEPELYARRDTKTLKKDKSGTSEERAYTLTYVNPVSHKTEVMEEKADIRIDDISTRIIEESVGINSGYPLYAYIASPIIRKEVVPWVLEEILNEREYGTPPESGSGTAIRVPDEAKKSEIVAVRKQEECAREAVVEAIRRKEDAEMKLGHEIARFEKVVQAVKDDGKPGQHLKKLSPLSRARYMVLLKKKLADRKVLLKLLMQDASFLRGIRKKLGSLTVEGLLDIVHSVKKIMEKEEK